MLYALLFTGHLIAIWNDFLKIKIDFVKKIIHDLPGLAQPSVNISEYIAQNGIIIIIIIFHVIN